MVGTAAPLRPGLTLWLWWVLANAVGEFAGLAASALVGALVALSIGFGWEPTGWLLVTAVVVVGGVEGFVVGLLVGAIHGGFLVWLLRRQ